MTRKKMLASLMAVPLFLGACDATIGIKVHEDQTTTAKLELRDTNNMLDEFQMEDLTCDDLAAELDADQDGVTIEDISEGDEFACRLSSDEDVELAEQLTETDETFILTLEGDGDLNAQELAMVEQFDVNLTYVIEMPGDIIRAEGAQIDGNVATFTGLETIVSGVEVEGYKTADGSSGISPILWIVLGVVLLAAIIGGLLFFRNKKNDSTPAPYTPEANSGEQPAYPQHGNSQQGYPQAGTDRTLAVQPEAGQSMQGQGDHDLNNPEPPVGQR